MKYYIQFFTFMCILIGVCSCSQNAKTQQQDEKEGISETVGSDRFSQLIADTAKVVVLDVRTKEELGEDCIQGAIHININDRDFREQCLKRLPKNKVVAVYCRTGFRSKTAANILKSAGYHAVNLREGIVGWKEEGRPVVKVNKR